LVALVVGSGPCCEAGMKLWGCWPGLWVFSSKYVCLPSSDLAAQPQMGCCTCIQQPGAAESQGLMGGGTTCMLLAICIRWLHVLQPDRHMRM
jgi:hypothetical protein